MGLSGSSQDLDHLGLLETMSRSRRAGETRGGDSKRPSPGRRAPGPRRSLGRWMKTMGGVANGLRTPRVLPDTTEAETSPPNLIERPLGAEQVLLNPSPLLERLATFDWTHRLVYAPLIRPPPGRAAGRWPCRNGPRIPGEAPGMESSRLPEHTGRVSCRPAEVTLVTHAQGSQETASSTGQRSWPHSASQWVPRSGMESRPSPL